MLEYRTSGNFPHPCEWEDFYDVSGEHPGVTITAGMQKEDVFINLCNDGFIDVNVTAPCITKELAESVLSAILIQPVEVVRAGMCQLV